MSLIKRLVVSASHRTGLFAFLREQWRNDPGISRLSALEASIGALDRQMKQVQSGMPAEVEELRDRVRRLEKETLRLQKALSHDRELDTRWDRLEAALDIDAVAASVRRSVEEATLETYPMAHLVLRNLLPDATYQAVLDAIPPDEFFPDRDPIKSNLKVKTLPPTAPVWTKRVLEFLEDRIIPHMLTPALVARLQPHIAHAYRADYGDAAAAAAALPHHASGQRLMLRRPGYKLEPHLDPQRAAVTGLLYFARHGDDTGFGTQLFAIEGEMVRMRASTFYPRVYGYECRLVKTVPFEPNTALVFLNRIGAHGAEIPADAPAETRRYSYQFYVSPDGAALEALTGVGEAAATSAQ